jgi:homoserine kinase type II
MAELARPSGRVLKAAWPETPGRAGDRPLPHGVIHADLFPDNVFFACGEAAAGFSGHDRLLLRLQRTAGLRHWPICLNAWCFEADGAFNVTKAQGADQCAMKACVR